MNMLTSDFGDEGICPEQGVTKYGSRVKERTKEKEKVQESELKYVPRFTSPNRQHLQHTAPAVASQRDLGIPRLTHLTLMATCHGNTSCGQC